MSVDILGTSCDQCRSMVQYCFTSTETRRLVRTSSPGRPPRLSHSSWTMSKSGKEQWFYTQGQSQTREENTGYVYPRANWKSGSEKRVIYPKTKSKKRKELWLCIPKGKFKVWERTRVINPRANSKPLKEQWLETQGQSERSEKNSGYIPTGKLKILKRTVVINPRTKWKEGKEQWLSTQGQTQNVEKNSGFIRDKGQS